MQFEDFVQNFNRIYVLRLMTDSEGEVWDKHIFHGEWKGESAGGCTNFATWPNNPQYALSINTPNTKVFLNLSQPDLRYVLKTNPSHYNRQYDPIGIVIMKVNDPKFKKATCTGSEKLATSLFCGMRDVSLEFLAQPGHYIILPCTFNPHIQMPFELGVYTQNPSIISEVKTFLPKNGIPGSWQGRTAGGCANYPKSWMNNPQFLLVCDSPGTVNVTLDQQLSPNQEVECVGIYIFRANGQRRLDLPAQLVTIPGAFENLPSVTETLRVDARANYIIMPTTFDPVDRRFEISVTSSDAHVATFVALQ